MAPSTVASAPAGSIAASAPPATTPSVPPSVGAAPTLVPSDGGTAGQVRTDAFGIEQVCVAAGPFTMGTDAAAIAKLARESPPDWVAVEFPSEQPAHEVRLPLHHAWQAGTVIAGSWAGSLCWFETGTTDSFGVGLAALSGGLGVVPGSHAPHYDGEAIRRPHYQRLIAEGVLPAGHAADDGAALVFHGIELAEVVASRPNARAYRVERGPDGAAIQTVLPVRYLG